MDLRAELASIVSADRVLTRYLDRIAYANDASVYRLLPRAVVQPRSIAEVRALFGFSHARRIPLTFRSAGTSLSGQAITDGILVDLSRHWRKLQVEENGRKVRVEPGVIGGLVNQHLQRYGAKIGPDPASINSCMMGGILANNSSGMCCGVVHNAYHTLESIRFLLPDGLEVDSAEDDAEEKLAAQASGLTHGLLALKRRIESQTSLRERIRTKYRLKNTTGYSLNAFIDFARPVEILSHLMIGSEGTLGFIAEAVLRTIPDEPFKRTGMLYFPDVPRACAAIAPLRDSGARALELMDRSSLRAMEGQPGAPAELAELPCGAAAILVEYQCRTEDELEHCGRDCERLLRHLPLTHAPELTRDGQRQAALWRMRKGLIPSVGAVRRRGTSFILEDVVFPVERLAEGVTELQSLFAAHRYDDAIVFGHARDGNLHFVLTQAFEQPAEVRRYDAFMQELAELVAVRHGGALKAEHGTGRNMAPFVVTEWGAEAYEIMRALKRLIDPHGLLNPGVIINDDPRAHVTHLKSLPAVEPEVDACIECGFCERACPSRDLTLTPRQRIVVRREMARLRAEDPTSPLLSELERDYVYAGLETCAADGLCATGCPVAIDTGKLTKLLRQRSHSEPVQELARILAGKFALFESGARLALRAARLARPFGGDRALAALTRRVRSLIGPRIPLWPDGLEPAGRDALPPTSSGGAELVYFPACVSRVLDGGPGAPYGGSLPTRVVRVAGRAGLALWIPDRVSGHCCGLPFSSKGYDRAYRLLLERTVNGLWSWSGGGRLPVVVDSSPCAQTLKQARPDLSPRAQRRFDGLTILDGIELAHDRILPRLRPRRVRGPVVLHPACSVIKMNLAGKLERLAAACAEEVDVPLAAGCCGFAGDRGLFFPELTAAAMRAEAAEVAARPYRGYYSSSRTCELGLSRATGRPYRSFWHLLDEATG